ncbi:NAD(P)/FAD-dependent oxidoreductase [Pseudodesulfovibrio thermohalotolerans]|uniref:NAD(P)/FAD-dependent oxidoreductase n=1 Tax=Pseudodesulfovibrio thermohalotolerans TaxID=2880651 RepID=UPI00244270DB|nr:NAD(P)/FAD-dependent oxidoreductase [Pseudodesulfovibrio thermohalotolerans]WFS62511.1 NAD(P)/FAD-dependent oxidoreductase [Pseudodesulfovibrio thermohalotolerans]
MSRFDAIILGAGASGLWCAMTAGARGRNVAVIDHGTKAARKVRISGGGKCNFTNLNVSPAHYLCANPHFVKSALARLSPWDVVGFLGDHGISFEERDHGQLFTLEGAGRVAGALLDRCARTGAAMLTGQDVGKVSGTGPFTVDVGGSTVTGDRLVLALGGPSWPQAGATDFGFRLAEQFGLALVPPRPGLVPLVFPKRLRPMCAEMAGNALPATVETGSARFTDPLLFTHRGVSGPAALQASNYWREHQPVTIDFLPGQRLEDVIAEHRASNRQLRNLLARILPKRLPGLLLDAALAGTEVSQLSKAGIETACERIHRFTFTPSETEGYAKAEVTVGGAATDRISSKTMECRDVPGLFVIGETLDVTGHLGGFNLHWAFASGQACGEAL